MSSDSPSVKLVSRDDQEFTLPLAAAKLSVFVRNSLGCDEDQNPAEEENEEGLKVDVIRVSGGCLGKVVEFMKHHNEEAMGEITMPLQGPTFEDVRILRRERNSYTTLLDHAETYLLNFALFPINSVCRRSGTVHLFPVLNEKCSLNF